MRIIKRTDTPLLLLLLPLLETGTKVCKDTLTQSVYSIIMIKIWEEKVKRDLYIATV